MRIFAAILIAAYAASAGVAVAKQMAPLSATERQIANVAAKSECAAYYWPGRGRAPAGYIKGMALTYAKSVCELQKDADTAVQVMDLPFGDPARDAVSFAFWGQSGPAKIAKLRTLYALAIGLGMRQSSGNTTVGRDRSAAHPTPETAEAGLFQTRYASMDANPWLAKLYDEYMSHPEECRLALFRQDVPNKGRPPVGTGDAAKYQTEIRKCPALAAEYAGVLLRVDRTEFGPITRHEAELRPECDAMLRQVEALVKCGE